MYMKSAFFTHCIYCTHRADVWSETIIMTQIVVHSQVRTTASQARKSPHLWLPKAWDYQPDAIDCSLLTRYLCTCKKYSTMISLVYIKTSTKHVDDWKYIDTTLKKKKKEKKKATNTFDKMVEQMFNLDIFLSRQITTSCAMAWYVYCWRLHLKCAFFVAVYGHEVRSN